MYPRLFIAIAMTSLLLTAQQDVPLRGPGQFSATAAGAVIGTLQGDASATRFSDGRREFYLLLNSDQMMRQKLMLSVTIKLPVPGEKAIAPTSHEAMVQWESLANHTRTSVPATASIEMKGKDLLTGKFTITSRDTSHPLTLTGKFENAPIIADVN